MDNNQQQKKKLNLNEKVGIKKLNILIAASAACALVLGGAITAGIFIGKDVIRQNEVRRENETVIIDSSCSDDTVISKEFTTDKEGNKVGIISSKNEKKIVGVSISKGDVVLKENEEFIANPISNSKNSSKSNSNENGSTTWNIVILKKAFNDHSGKLRIVSRYGSDTPEKGLVTISLDDQFPGGSSSWTSNIYSGELLQYPTAPHHDDYVLAGWYLDKECTTPFNFSKPVTENVSLYGKWETSTEKGLSFIPDDTKNPTKYTVKLDMDKINELPDYVAIPSKHDGKPVVGIEEWKYSGSKWDDYGSFGYGTMKAISIPSTMTAIPYYAFNECYKLKSVSLPDTIKDLGYAAFYYCTALEDINLNEGLLTIQEYCFEHSGLKSITLPSTLTYLSYYSFYSATSLNYADFSKCINLVEIPYYCFYGCYSLKNVILPSDGVLSKIGEYAFYYCCSLEFITIPSTVEFIDCYAFYYCYSLKHVEFAPDSCLSTLGEEAFSYCYCLESIEIPESLVYFDYNTFPYCYSLNDIVLKNKTATYYVEYNDDGAKKIENYSPYAEGAISPIDLIGMGATFRLNGVKDETRGIEFVAVSDDECIVSRRFDETKTEISIPTEVTYQEKTYKVVGIGTEAFSEGSVSSVSNRVTSITFEIDNDNENKNLRYISHYAFYNCQLLHAFTNLDKCVNLTKIGEYAFEYVSYSCTDEQKFDLDLSKTSIKHLAEGAFYYTYRLKSIKLPESLIGIGNYAFSCCYSLEDADFSKCKNLEVLGYNTDYEDEGGCVFEDCTQLTTIDLSNTNVYVIPFYTFYEAGLVSVKLPNTIVSIESCAFYGCSDLTSITIPENTIKIGLSAFDGCSDLTEVIIDSPFVNVFLGKQGSNKILDECINLYVPEGTKLEEGYIEGYVKQETSSKPGYDHYKWTQEL